MADGIQVAVVKRGGRSTDRIIRALPGEDLRLHEHIQLSADRSWTAARQLVEVMHHVHLIVVAEGVGTTSAPTAEVFSGRESIFR